MSPSFANIPFISTFVVRLVRQPFRLISSSFSFLLLSGVSVFVGREAAYLRETSDIQDCRRIAEEGRGGRTSLHGAERETERKIGIAILLGRMKKCKRQLNILLICLCRVRTSVSLAVLPPRCRGGLKGDRGKVHVASRSRLSPRVCSRKPSSPLVDDPSPFAVFLANPRLPPFAREIERSR